MFECRDLVALSWFPSFWRWPFAAQALDQRESDKSLYIVSPLVNGSALAESIVTQLIHALEWLRIRWFASTSWLPACGCYDECNNMHAQYTTSQLMHG